VGPLSEALESVYANIIKQGSLPPPVDWHPAEGWQGPALPPRSRAGRQPPRLGPARDASAANTAAAGPGSQSRPAPAVLAFAAGG